MKKIKVILSVLLMAAAISFTACSNASSGSSDPSTPAPATTPSTPSSGGSGSGSQTPVVTYIGSKAPTVADAIPLPNEETTPPVIKIYFCILINSFF